MEDFDEENNRQTQAEKHEGIERRLALRILRLWWDARQDDEIPSLEDISRQEMENQWPAIVLLAVPGGADMPVFERIGEDFTKDMDEDLTGRPVGEAPQDSVLQNIIHYYAQVLEKKVPVSRGDEITDENGETLAFRSIILPLSDDGENINFLLAGGSFKKPGMGDPAETS